jgi:hypothetical protein
MMDYPDFNKQFITILEIQNYIYNSWVKGFRHLAWITRKNKAEFQRQNLPEITDKQAIHWAEKYKKQIYMSVANSFTEIGVSNNQSSLEFNTFLGWLYCQDRNLHFSYGTYQLHIAVSLMSLDDVGFDMNTSYPSI